ncbi:hypothetical protein [Legionella clemsonensis]|uniref:Uncharacterized protein n=1 Tax=Legionella clemsonensis TaxID=1867846 RepID=A0A222P0E0_9GAMM|nr:hypothetical protein [Legionella clemsonensis]ASQ45302.1 hypothetical protein clem_03720 [Legionella clemsonensis]
MGTKEETKQPDKQKDIAQSYNKFKEFEGKRYTGMKVGRSHSWIYDAGPWKETKITPDKWEINYTVTKRRKGRAPEGSGVPVGTKYHWYILAHQIVEKLNANDYSTEMRGLKYKVAHQRANKDDWNISELAQKKRLVKVLKEIISTLEEEIEEAAEKKQTKPRKEKVIAKKENLLQRLKKKNLPRKRLLQKKKRKKLHQLNIFTKKCLPEMSLIMKRKKPGRADIAN